MLAVTGSWSQTAPRPMGGPKRSSWAGSMNQRLDWDWPGPASLPLARRLHRLRIGQDIVDPFRPNYTFHPITPNRIGDTTAQADAVSSARREESGKVTLTLRGRSEKLTASRLYAHLFKGM